MNKYFYPIFKLPTFYERDYVKEELPLYVKWWLLGKAGRKLSEILTGSEFTLLHTLNKKFKLLQIKGNTEQDGEPTPETPVPIKNVTGNANVKIQNKNLFSGNFEIGGYYIENGNKDQSDNRIRTIDYLKLKAGTYTLSFTNSGSVYILKYDKNKTYLGYSQVMYRTTEGSFTLENNVEYFTFYYIPYNHELTIDEICQLEQGTTATSYVPHQEQNLPFTFAQSQRAMQGTQLLDDGIHQKRKQFVLTEEKINQLYPALSTFYNIQCISIDKRNLGWKVSLNSGICLIDRYKEMKNTSSIASGQFATNLQQYNLNIFDDRFTDLATAKELLVGTIIEIEQAEEEIIPYNETQQAQYNAIKQAKSYDDQTNISSTSDELPPLLDIQYWKERGAE